MLKRLLAKPSYVLGTGMILVLLVFCSVMPIALVLGIPATIILTALMNYYPTNNGDKK